MANIDEKDIPDFEWVSKGPQNPLPLVGFAATIALLLWFLVEVIIRWRFS